MIRPNLGIFLLVLAASSCKENVSKISSSEGLDYDTSFLSDQSVEDGFLAVNDGAIPDVDSSLLNKLTTEDVDPDGEIIVNDEIPVKPSGANLADVASGIDYRLKKWTTPVRDQGQLPTCSAFSTIAALETKIKIDTQQDVDLSEAHMWNLEGKKAQSLNTAINIAVKNPITLEKFWPYAKVDSAIKNAPGFLKIEKIGKSSGSLKEIKQALLNKTPLIFGFKVTKQFMNAPKGIVSAKNMQFVTEQSQHAYHGVAIVGFKDNPNIAGGGYFIIKNSWGVSWGDRGYAYVPYDYCNHDADCHTREVPSWSFATN